MKFLRQMAIIMGISFLAELLELLIPLPIAASMYGLVLMLFGLVTKLIPLEKVEGAADFLIEIMPLLFVPPTVSVIANIEALKSILVPLLVICISTTILIMAVTGRTAQLLIRHGKSGSGGGEVRRVENRKEGNRRVGNKGAENKWEGNIKEENRRAENQGQEHRREENRDE
ncbi:MAG: CidA/LrgA family protein [Acetatifactor sp.]